MLSPLTSTPSPEPPAAVQTRLRAAAQDLEASFIAEMLRAAGAERTPGLGEGDGESPFASFLLDIRAREIARAGGLGLSEVLFQSLVKSDGAR
jgi:flagellar protein FlgJ